MFNIGPLELIVLAFVALIVVGPEKLPGHARDAARMIRSLRDLATGARGQFKQELGEDLADLNLDALRELRSLNPRSALMKALFDDTDPTVADDVRDNKVVDPMLRAAQPPDRLVKPPTAPPPSMPVARPDAPPNWDTDAT